MSALLAILLGVILVPLFVASWRMSLAGLTAQGLLLACIACATLHEPPGTGDALRLLDLVVVRGLCAPVALGLVLRARRTPTRSDLIPPSILWWTIVLGTTLAAFDFAGVLVPVDGPGQTLVAVATVELLVGFLILSTQSGVLPQMFGALHLQNAIALLELGEPHPPHAARQLLQTAALLATLVLFRWYLANSQEQAP